MKIIYVHGDDDYGALNFEQSFGLERAKDEVAKGNNKFASDNEGEWYAEVKEFGEVDAAFIDFIKSEIQDYDAAKHKNFYVLS
jgi:hypothetical protein